MDEKQPTIEEMVKLCTQLGNRVVAYQAMLNEVLDTLKDIASDASTNGSPELRSKIAMLAMMLAGKLAAMPELEVPDALVL